MDNKVAPQAMPALRRWMCQFDALSRKTFESILRKPVPLFFIVLIPISSNLIFAYLDNEVYKLVTQQFPFPNSFILAPPDEDGRPTLPKCMVIGGEDGKPKRDTCHPLGYTWRSSALKSFAEELVAGLGLGENTHEIMQYGSVDELAAELFDHPGLLDAALVIEAVDAEGLQYSLWKNETGELEGYTRNGDYHHYAKVQKAIEESALRIGIGSPKVTISTVKATINKFADVQPEEVKSDNLRADYPALVDTVGGSFVVFGLTTAAVFTMQFVITEKRDGLLGLLRMTGLVESTYWLSWYLVLMLMYFVIVLLCSLANKPMEVNIFSNVDVGVHFIASFFFMAATVSSMLMFASVVKNPMWVSLTQFIAVLFNIMWQLFVSSFGRADEVPQDFWTANSLTNPDFEIMWKIVLFFMPVYHYGKILNDINTVTGVHDGRSEMHGGSSRLRDRPIGNYDYDLVHKAIGYNDTVGFPACFKGYTSAYQYRCEGLHVRCGGLGSCPATTLLCTEPCDWFDVNGHRVGSWYSPSVAESCIFLMLNAVIYLALAWYLAQVFSAGTGSSKPLYFIFLPSYWTGSPAVTALDESPAVTKERELSKSEGSCRLWKLSKSYDEVTAVKELSLAMFKDQIFCLLGQNGAGKTTTINVLTGLHPATFGEAFVSGLAVRHEMSKIQTLMGACPQDNVLFDGLSGQSHLHFWGRFRGMNRSELKKEAEELLRGVALEDAASRPATAYSGGMKRRLSVAIAYINAPTIVFLDEPTTGLDPLSRMRTWESISRLKQGRIVCLTTHSMEEADCLGDNVGIMATGRLRALGTPLFLKGKYGKGYHITLMCVEDRSHDVITLLKKFLPSADIISNCAGYVTIGVERRMYSLVPSFFEKLEDDKKRGNALVYEWGLSASTLEEVFLKVAVTDKSLNADLTEATDNVALRPGFSISALDGMPVSVTMFNSRGQSVTVDHVVSQVCGDIIVEICPDLEAAEPSSSSAASKSFVEGSSVQIVPVEPGKQNPSLETITLDDDGGNNGDAVPTSTFATMAASVTMTFVPGKQMGLESPDWSTGAITGVRLGGQAMERGVERGWRIVKVNGEAYTEELLDQAAAGQKSFELEFERPSQIQPAAVEIVEGLIVAGALPEPTTGDRVAARGDQQVRSILLRSAASQKKQFWPNCCRICCVAVCVCFSLLWLLLVGFENWGARFTIDSCPDGHTLFDPTYRLVGFRTCDKTNYINYHRNHFRISEPRNMSRCISGLRVFDDWHSAQFHRHSEVLAWQDVRRACFQFRYANQDDMWDPQFEFDTFGINPNWCRGSQCDTTYTEQSSSTQCVTGGDSPETACWSPNYLPNFCSMMARRLRILDDSDFKQWSAFGDPANLTTIPDVVNSLATLSIWHQGSFDAAFLGNVPNGRFVRPGVDSTTSNWACGAVQLKLTEVTDMNADMTARQEEFRGQMVMTGDLKCSAGGSNGLEEESRGARREDRRDDRRTYARLGYANPGSYGSIEVPWSDLRLYDVNKEIADKFPDIGIALNSYSSGDLSYSIWVYGRNENFLEDEHRSDLYPNYGRAYPFVRKAFAHADSGASGVHRGKCAAVDVEITKPAAVHAVISSFHNGYLQKEWTAAGHAGDAPRIKSSFVPMVQVSYKSFEIATNQAQAGSSIVIIILPIVSMLFFPVSVSNIQQEKAEKNVLAMQIQSLRLIWYWVSVYTWNILLYFLSVGTYYLLVVVTGLSVFKTVHHGHFIFVLLLWGHSQVALAICLGTIMGRSRLTVLVSYMFLVSTVIGSMTLFVARRVFTEGWPTSLLLIPSMNFVRCFLLVTEQGESEMSDDISGEFKMACGLQFGVGSFLLLFGIGLHTYIVNDVSGGQLIAQVMAQKPKEKDQDVRPFDESTVKHFDEDVAAEAARVESDSETSEDCVRVRLLAKRYSSGFLAVKGVSFAIKKGECFGLLGPNGAGKTTVISMLSGSQSITSGSATISGLDVKKDIQKIYKTLGIVPQFDVVWQDLTVYDHLLAFARMKGTSRSQEKMIARQVAEAVRLDGDPLRQTARQLSGGMRRRLSLGIALVTNPEVLFLDEPSTGLDPETRQSLWRTVSAITPGRCIILTTHSMEEADALCGRIGIMAAGQLRCLGTPLHLKNKFGKGYQFAVSMKEGQAEGVLHQRLDELDKFVKENISRRADVLPTFKRANLRTYMLPADDLQVSSIFKKMTEATLNTLRIQDWSLNQTSLNEVFLRIATESEGTVVEA